MALDKVTETSSSLRPSTRLSSDFNIRKRITDVRALEQVSAETRELIHNGAASTNATTAHKFALGDRVVKLLDILYRAEEQATEKEDSREFLELCRERLAELLDDNLVSRGTLINYGKISRVFGPDHIIRKSILPFSFAKTLSSLEDEGERDYWFGQALLYKMTVSQLQAELSSRRGRDSGVTDRRKQSRAFVCAQTGLAITEDNLKTMVVVYPPSPNGPALQKTVKCRGKGKAATEASTSLKAAPLKAAPPKPLRFRDMTALAAWSEAHKREYPEARPTPTLPVTERSEERTTDSEQHAADAANAPANDISASSMVNPREDSSSN